MNVPRKDIYSVEADCINVWTIWGPDELREKWAVEIAEMIHRDTGEVVRVYKNGKWFKKVEGDEGIAA